MELSRRNLLSLAGLSLSAGILSGCAKQHPNVHHKKSPIPAATLSWWHQNYPNSELNQELVKWAKNVNNIEIEINTPQDYQKAITSILSTPDRPDIFDLPIPNLTQHIKAKDIADLADIFTPEKSDYLDFACRVFNENKSMYGIPIALDTQFFAYRKSTFAKSEINPPKNLNELIEAANKLQSRKIIGLYAGGEESIPIFANTLVWAAGADLISEQKPAFNKPEVIEIIKAFKEAKIFYAPTNGLNGNSPEILISGKAAIQWLGSWDIPKLQETLKEDLGILPFLGINGQKVIPAAVHGIAAGNNENKLTEAKRFIQELWIKDLDKQERFCQDFGFRIPARKSLIAKLGSDTTKELADLVIKYGKSTPIAWRDAIQQDFTFAVTEIVFKDADPEKSLTTAMEKITKKINN